MIAVEHLVKHYRVAARSAGIGAALRSVFNRTYRTVRAVDDITFRIQPGESVGFLGPNGAGKTTTLKVLAGLLVPTSGRVQVGEFTPQDRRNAFLRSITLVTGQKNQLIWDLPPVDTFDLNAAIYGIGPDDMKRRLAELVSLLEIGEIITKPTRQLSLGERMKCELTAALLHYPRVLFLDEPTIGLDVTMQASIRRFIRGYCRRHGATVLLTSHNMADVSEICDRVILIDYGKLRFDGSITQLVRRTRPYKRLELRFSSPVEPERLQALGDVVLQTDSKAVIQIPRERLRASMESALKDLEAVDLTATDAPLEEVLAEFFSQRPDARVRR
ncbi:MAG: ATP-binding cassette domain-containing protein [Deltaproteobacteria bacterium]|nr:ATP-binding cassette domain-containing protein [Deltaproteobacteria bacterium]